MVSGGTVNSDCSSLSSSLNSYSSIISSLGSSWKGPSYDSISSKASEFASSYTNSIKNQMSSFASACNLYKEYENAKHNLSTARSNYNTAVSNNDTASANRYASDQSNLTNRINNLKKQIESLLSSVKSVVLEAQSLTGSAATGTVGTTVSTTSTLGTPTYGSFQKKTFSASNGTKVNYYEYVPNYGTNVSGLPLHIYLHGSGESGNGVLDCGLPKLIKNQQINPSGIVLCLQAPNSSTFSKTSYQDAVVELAKSYSNVNQNKVSISGHSMGAIAGYKIIARYPNYFSAFIPISGKASSSETVAGAKNVKVWAFHGENDKNVDYKTAVQNIKQLQSMGASARMYTYENEGHSKVQNYTFQRTFVDENGNQVNPLEWAFQQTRST